MPEYQRQELKVPKNDGKTGKCLHLISVNITLLGFRNIVIHRK
jgi:hypothetical protein